MDQDVINLAKAIRERESGGNFKAVGDAGTSKGGYQWQEGTWKEHAKRVLGDEKAEMTPENQNAVAYKMIKEWKDQGKTPAQIAAKWNSGQFDNWENKKGHNKKLGLDYDVPAYVKAVTDNYQRIKGETIQTPEVQPEVKKTGMEKVTNTLDTIFGGGKIGGMIGNLIAKNSKSGKDLQEQERVGNVPEGTVAETFKGPSVSQIGGDALKIASTFIPVGRGAKALEGVAGKFLPKVASKIAGNVGAGAGTGYALDVAENLRDESTSPFKAGLGTGVGATIPLLSPFLKGANSLRKQVTGMTTGAGHKAITEFEKAIAKGGSAAKEATNAMRGKIPAEQIVSETEDALQGFIKKARDDYTKQLEKLGTSTKVFNKQPIIEKFNKMLDDFGVMSKDGIPDFSRSPGLGRYKDDLMQISEVLSDWGSQQGDNTLVGMDKLKQIIDDFRIGSSDSKKFDAFIQGMKSEVKNMLKNEPGYLDMLKGYETNMEVIKDIKRTLSIGGKASQDTAFKKLMSALRENQDMREKLLKELDDFSGGTLIPKIAGQQLSEKMPKGLVGKLALGGAGGVAVGGGTGLIPFLGYMLFASPRFIGEISRVLGLGARGTEILKKVLMLGAVNRSNISPGDVILNKMKGQAPKVEYQTAPMLNLIDQAKQRPMDLVK